MIYTMFLLISQFPDGIDKHNPPAAMIKIKLILLILSSSMDPPPSSYLLIQLIRVASQPTEHVFQYIFQIFEISVA